MKFTNRLISARCAKLTFGGDATRPKLPLSPKSRCERRHIPYADLYFIYTRVREGVHAMMRVGDAAKRGSARGESGKGAGGWLNSIFDRFVN